MRKDIVQQQLSQPAERIRYCRRCHRKLKNEISMERGFGPVCFQREAQDRAAEKNGAA